MKRCLVILAVAVSLSTNVLAQKPKNLLRETDREFFKTDEARRIGDQLLVYQRMTGGWPKNIDMTRQMSDEELATVLKDKDRPDDSTTDNNATTLQMIYLARLYRETHDRHYRDAFRKGVDYLLSGQYEKSGGWPQFWPKMRDYQIHITYNDDAMVNTMNLLKRIGEGKGFYGGDLTSEEQKQRIREAFKRGIECILNTQITYKGELTVWCQQHDRETLKPAPARAFELAAFCSQESAAIVQLLMELPNPDERVKTAIRQAMKWFKRYRLTGVRLENYTNSEGKPDRRLVKDSKAQPIWARYYDLERCKPFVCDRDGIPRTNLEDIGYERRNGYSWYNQRPADLFPLYEKWEATVRQEETGTINHRAVVGRNNPVITATDSLASLSVGNGHFVATVDVTGLQSFPQAYKAGVPLNSMSDWGWHQFENPKGLTPSDSEKSFDLGHGHQEVYAIEYKKPEDGRHHEATEYFRMNPHRLNLGTIGLNLQDSKGRKIELSQLGDIRQELRLLDGEIESSFQADGEAVEVTTGVHPARDVFYARIKSPLIKDHRATVDILFSYPTGRHADDANDWTKPDRHQSIMISQTDHSALIERSLDATTYYVLLQWEGQATITEKNPHHFKLSSDSEVLTLAATYSALKPENTRFDYRQFHEQTTRHWNNWWNEGAMVDFSGCTDPRARELERRVVLSQYLTQINCANQMPPQESGLTYNTWFGRPHLEMTWWHAVDFALWNRPEVIAQMLKWYHQTAYPIARKIAERQGFKGVRWMKMTDPWGGEAPSNTGSFLIWQQPHYIYLAEEMYRAVPTAETLKEYAEQVEATAEFMADFVTYDTKSKHYILKGATAMQECMTKDISYNQPFELAYWRYGLSVAQEWRQRQGKARHPQWDDIIKHLSPLPEAGGIYTAGIPVGQETALEAFDPFDATSGTIQTFADKCRNDHPAVLGACGLLPDSPLYHKEKMKQTLSWVMDNWNWATTWGWDYGMIAMTAARLGDAETALKALLIDTQKNTYLPSGHNFQTPDRLRIYLPGNGALLTAVAMMCAGWDGCTVQNPGFPKDGTWNVRWEGLKKMQ